MTNEEVEAIKAAAIERTNNRTLQQVIEDDYKYYCKLGYYHLKNIIKLSGCRDYIKNMYTISAEDLYNEHKYLIEEDLHDGMSTYNEAKGFWIILKQDGLYETLMERIK